nr:synapse differentiation-inducing gene protein 1-like [Lytechinus pictus]
MKEKPEEIELSQIIIIAEHDNQQHVSNELVTEHDILLYGKPNEIEQRDYFYLALFACLCCFFPVGICALTKSIQVRRYMSSGQTLNAVLAYHDARYYTSVAIGVGSAFLLTSVCVFIVIYAAFRTL